MSSNKNRDLAKELVDLLLNKEIKKNAPTTTEATDKSKGNPEAVTESLAPTRALTDKSKSYTEIAKVEVPLPVAGPADYQATQTSGKIVESVPLKATQNASSQVLATQRGSEIYNEVSQLVGGAEAVKVAQARITNLERERDQLRDEAEKLLSTTESLQHRLAEFKAQNETLERKQRERIEILEEEKIVFKGRLSAREQEVSELKKQYEELQMRFQNDLRKVRVRERELENRQELLRAETAAIVASKDELILELKRQLEQLSFELDNFKAKSADLNAKISEFHDRNHRTVKALRLALSVLEVGDVDEKIKKVTGT